MKRLLCLFLVVIMALTVFAGCKKESPNTPGASDTDEETHTDTNGSENGEPKKSWKDLPKEKFNGEEYNILGRKHTPWGSDDHVYRTGFPFLLIRKPDKQHKHRISGVREALSLYYNGNLMEKFEDVGFDLPFPPDY